MLRLGHVAFINKQASRTMLTLWWQWRSWSLTLLLRLQFKAAAYTMSTFVKASLNCSISFVTLSRDKIGRKYWVVFNSFLFLLLLFHNQTNVFWRVFPLQMTSGLYFCIRRPPSFPYFLGLTVKPGSRRCISSWHRRRSKNHQRLHLFL